MNKLSILNIVIAKVWGGGEQYVYDTAKEMRRQGITVYIAVDKTNSTMKQRFSEVAQVIDVNLYQVAGLFSVSELKQFILEHKIDILQCHSGHALQLCILLKKLTSCKLAMFKHNAILGKKDFYHTWQRKQVDVFICVSQLVFDLQTNGLSKDELSKYVVVHNGIDLSRFNKYDGVQKDATQFVIGYAGRIAENKGIEVLLQAIKTLTDKYDDIFLKIAGMDEKGYLAKVRQIIVEHHLEDKVQYMGVLNDVERFYKQLDVLVLPSVVREAFGLVLCEALYCGIPVITTDSGGQKEIVTSATYGQIIPVNDSEALSHAVEYYYNNENEFDSDEAKRYIAEKFSVKACVMQLMRVYQTI